jgi:thiamine-phosphate pyrophosphorylase
VEETAWETSAQNEGHFQNDRRVQQDGTLACMSGPLLYYITDRSQFAGNESERRRKLLDKIAEAASCGVDYIQLREKDLSSRDLEWLAREAMHAVGGASCPPQGSERKTRLVINSRSDIALAVGADGVHLRSDDISVADARAIWRASLGMTESQICSDTSSWTVAASCHSPHDVRRAADEGADFVVFGPVFEKRDRPESQLTGLAALRKASHSSIPVLALGGVTVENARSCLTAGAAGIAGIRLFQENDITEVVTKLSAVLGSER